MTLDSAAWAAARSLLALALSAPAFGAAPAKIDFNRDIRPAFNANCTGCHGGVKMAGEISFVFRQEAMRTGKSGRITIAPGQPEESELIRRITSTDPEYRMPPPDHAGPLGEKQIALFRQWIVEGAEWTEHWAFVAPSSPAIPTIWNAKVNGPIDRFIVARLEREKLALSAEADRDTLLRRVSLDLIGLPPTPAELDAFVADRASGAFERQVDRLLASPHFGERWATPWMDLARYADTKGYEADFERSVWKYRDWLIDAYNRNLPYDQFIVKQLAGDLLPEATLDDRIATAFHRHTQTNDEGGTDDEEFRMAAVLDRVATTWSALNGVTFGCTQCHSHPYDPIRHEEYYQFLDFFNNTADSDRPDDFPTLRVPDDRSRHAEADGLQRALLAARLQAIDAARTLADSTEWGTLPIAAAAAMPVGEFRLADGEAFLQGTYQADTQIELSISADIRSAHAIRFEVPPVNPDKARHTPERGFIVTRIELMVRSVDGRETPVPVARFFADTALQAPEKQTAGPKPAENVPAPSPLAPGFYFAATTAQNSTRTLVAALPAPLTLGAGEVLVVRLIHGARIHEKTAVARRLRLATTRDRRWAALAAEPAFAEADIAEADLVKRIASLPGSDVPMLVELPAAERRETRVFVRGNWLDKAGPPQTAGVPRVFPPLKAKSRPNRLDLARWFVEPGHPLTARVAVNRFWEQVFGAGLVPTLEDFGSVGEPPSHPELLDWLAVHFERDLRWDVKSLLREIVTSATYRQQSHASAALLERDPRNRLLSRGPRSRLTAEMVRDQALAASGLLSRKLHGPPVMPPQPDGVWESARSSRRWVESKGEDRYRRSVYTFWKRTAAYQSFMSFDAPARDICTVRRVPTNTPLQALVTLNDPVYHEAALTLARRLCGEEGGDLSAQIRHGIRLVTGQVASSSQLRELRSLHTDTTALARAEGAADPGLVALTAVATAILNLDTALVK